jgi:hypothetical protein
MKYQTAATSGFAFPSLPQLAFISHYSKQQKGEEKGGRGPGRGKYSLLFREVIIVKAQLITLT